MTGTRRALIVANDTYDHASFAQLRAPAADAAALAGVLGDPEIGGFTVAVVHNEPSYDVQTRIEDVFADSRPDDLLLLHFSGHGVKSDTGELFVAARNTRPDRLASTAVSADFIQRCMKTSRARSIVLFLDCCYGGAFGQGVAVRAAGPVNVMDSFPAGRLGGGRGRAVISASSAIEYAFEGTALAADERAKPSVFTSAVVEGLRTGAADRDEDGLVSLDELYDYVFDRVRAENPKQTPGRDVEMSGDVYLAHSRRRRLRPQPIPDAIAAALTETNPTFRRGAISELRDRLRHEDPGAALGALEALREVVRTDTKSVADDAEAAIASATMAVVPSSFDFGEVAVGAGPQSRTVEVQGPALARAVTVQAEAPLEAVVEEDGRVTVTLLPVRESFEGQVTITSPVGSLVVPVTAHVPSDEAAPVAVERELVERRITPSAQQVPIAHPSQQSNAEERSTAPSPGPVAPLSGRSRGFVSVTSALGGLLVLASYAAPWTGEYMVQPWWPGFVVGIFIVGIAAIVAGIAVVVDQKGQVAAGFILGVSVVAANAILTAFGIMADVGAVELRLGWVLNVVGQVLIVAAGLASLVSVMRAGALALEWPTRPGRERLAILALVVIGCGVLVVYAVYLGDAEGSKPYGAIAMAWAVTWLAVGAVAVSARPPALARSFLAGWALAALAQPLSDWSYLGDNGNPSQGMPILVIVLVALVVAAITLDRRGERPAG
ncbi:MAG TPA: caspase family protein [Intrasporangium sp.]|uniref:caspase family protein n=1 Tax=Intrasporangium sp. TaxID=1925024 RepID=UPI002B4732E1|nr:caspase family protein [Intrasporangium sp.]HKX67282.1 caspase family protein [Intrasporangium sp.]